jgi:hypothetical protein
LQAVGFTPVALRQLLEFSDPIATTGGSIVRVEVVSFLRRSPTQIMPESECLIFSVQVFANSVDVTLSAL